MANDPLQPMFKCVSIKYEQTALQFEFKDLFLLLPDSCIVFFKHEHFL